MSMSDYSRTAPPPRDYRYPTAAAFSARAQHSTDDRVPSYARGNLSSYSNDTDANLNSNNPSESWSPRHGASSCPQPERFQVPFYYPPPTAYPHPHPHPHPPSSSSSLSTPVMTSYASPHSPPSQSKPYPHHSPPDSAPSSPTTRASAAMDNSQDFVAIPTSPQPTHSSSTASRPYPSPTGSPITLPPPPHASDPFRQVKDTLIAQVQRLPLPYYHHELIIKGENAAFPNVLYFDIRHTYFPNVPPSRSILVQWDHPNTPPIVLAQVYSRAYALDTSLPAVDQIASVVCRVPCAGILTELHPDMPAYLPAGVGWMHSGCDLVYYPTSRVYRDTMRHAKCQWLIDPRRKTLKCDKCTGMLTRMNRERVEVEGKPTVDDKYKRYHPSLLPYLKQHYASSSTDPATTEQV